MSSVISKARAEELDAAWEAASPTARLRLNRMSWVSVGDDTSYFEHAPSQLEIRAADRIDELEAKLKNAGAALRAAGEIIDRALSVGLQRAGE